MPIWTPPVTAEWTPPLNSFAVSDVDGDGQEELVLLQSCEIYAGYRAMYWPMIRRRGQ